MGPEHFMKNILEGVRYASSDSHHSGIALAIAALNPTLSRPRTHYAP